MTNLPSPKDRRRLREAKSLTEKELGALIGVTAATVRAWEAGRTNPQGRRCEAYARVLSAIAAEFSGPGAASDPGSGPGRTAAEPGTRTSGQERAGDAASSPRPDPSAPSRASAARTRPRSASKRAPRPTATTAVRHPQPPSAGRATVTAKVDAGAGAATDTSGARDMRTEPLVSAPPATASGPSAPEPDTQPLLLPDPGSEPASADEPAAPEPGKATPAEAFDLLYARAATTLVHQTHLLTGRRRLAEESVERAFHLAWERWPEVATDRDPAGWVRAAAYEYAMSPWHRLRRVNKQADPRPTDPEQAPLRKALLTLPPCYRRTLLLYDGLGLDLPETAAETEASTPATANRLLHARAAVAERVPELETPERLQERLGALALAGTGTGLPAAAEVRTGSERRAQFWTRLTISCVVLLTVATLFTLATAPTHYARPTGPPQRVGGVPPRGGPQQLTRADKKLWKKLRSTQPNGPGPLVPRPL
ncbi:transcriptional regulator [Streptomyces sp. NBC_00344]|uniref:transcriptional regulator n=1 Tax=Streptomyces sp. NBC_00344 TaxID=2975720 RepID=UPI002E1B051F